MKTKYVILVALIALVAGLFSGAMYQRATTQPVETIVRDTVTVRDTVRMEVPKPVYVAVVHYDTVPAPTAADSVDNAATGLGLSQAGAIVVSIEQKTYSTPDYKAVIEGWRSNLVSMEVYPKTTTIRETVTKLKAPRWSITVGPGVGWDGQKIRPYVGVTAGFVLWSK
jgi:hypothetical protein